MGTETEGICGYDETFYYYGHHQKLIWKQQTTRLLLAVRSRLFPILHSLVSIFYFLQMRIHPFFKRMAEMLHLLYLK